MRENKIYTASEVRDSSPSELTEQELKFVKDITYDAYLHSKNAMDGNKSFHKILVLETDFRIDVVAIKLAELGYTCSFKLNSTTPGTNVANPFLLIYSFNLDWSEK